MGSYLRDQIARSNRNLLLLNGFLLPFLCFAAINLIPPLFSSPAPLNVEAIRSATSPRDLPQRFVRLENVTLCDTGFAEFDSRSKQEKYKYSAMPIGDEQFLLVRRRPADVSTTFTGYLTVKPSLFGFQSALSAPTGRFDVDPETGKVRLSFTEASRPIDWSRQTLPIMLDTTESVRGAAICAAIVFAGALVCLFNLGLGGLRLASPSRHPILKNCSKYGPLLEVIDQIDKEVAAQAESRSYSARQPVVTSHWLVAPQWLGLQIVSLDEVVWVHLVENQRTAYGVHIGTNWAVALKLRDDRQVTIETGKSESQARRMLSQIIAERPWIWQGHDDKLEEMWKDDLVGMTRAVDERREKMTQERPLANDGPFAEFSEELRKIVSAAPARLR